MFKMFQDKKLLFAMVMSVLTVFMFHYFFGGEKTGYEPEATGLQSGKFYPILSKEDLNRHQEMATLVSREIDFRDADRPGKLAEKIVSIENAIYKIDFSNYGGVIASIAYLNRQSVNGIPLKSVLHKEYEEREESCFMLALAERTPLFYEVTAVNDHDDYNEIVYQTMWDNWTIVKTYQVHKSLYKIILKLDFIPNASNASVLHARLFVPSPFLATGTKEAPQGVFAGTTMHKIALVAPEDLMNPTPQPSLFGTQNKYFGHVMVADHEHFVRMAYFKQEERGLYSILAGPAIMQKSSWKLEFFMGPKDIHDLTAVDARLEGLLNFGMFSWLCKLLIAILGWLYNFVGNYGFAIILLTILIKLPLLPLSIKAAAIQERQQKYAPHIARIRQKYSNDSSRMMLELQRFHQDHNISPAAPMVGCLPLLIDIPIMFALYNVLGNYIDLYQAPFVLWITDLSAKDPYYVLPILMGISMMIQQRVTPTGDPKMKMIGVFMSLVFSVISANFAAGLVLYWLSKNVLTIGEYFIRKMIERRS